MDKQSNSNLFEHNIKITGISKVENVPTKVLSFKRLLAFLMLALLLLLLPVFAYANSAEPPSIIFIMKSAPKDVSLTINGSNDGIKRVDKAGETYFTVYQFSPKEDIKLNLEVSGAGGAFEIQLDHSLLRGYNTILTLNFKAQALSEGKLLSRSILLIGMRVILTLLIEGIVFLAFGYRKKRTWVVFFVINLTTQIYLNIRVNTLAPIAASYSFFYLIIIEFIILLAEIFIALIFINEHRRLRTFFCVITANLASWVLGGLLITYLPV